MSKKFYSITPLPQDDSLYLNRFTMIRETPCGYWLYYGSPSELWIQQALNCKDGLRSLGCFWISKSSKKRKAYPTPEEAIESFIKRSRRYIKILESRLCARKIHLRMAERGNIRNLPQKLNH